jgi:hypothetical protein
MVILLIDEIAKTLYFPPEHPRLPQNRAEEQVEISIAGSTTLVLPCGSLLKYIISVSKCLATEASGGHVGEVGLCLLNSATSGLQGDAPEIGGQTSPSSRDTGRLHLRALPTPPWPGIRCIKILETRVRIRIQILFCSCIGLVTTIISVSKLVPRRSCFLAGVC